jgi:surfeit locus 1 family protein
MSQRDLQLLKSILTVSRVASRPAQPRSAPKLRRNITSSSRRSAKSADDPDFVSVVDAPPKLVSTKKKATKLGIATLALIPLTAFCLGTWQVQRLEWKTRLIAKFEDRLIRAPLPLPPRIDPDAVHEFDYRRVYTTGKLRHDQEMLIGPRMHDGKDGFQVITPLDREDGTTILVNRGWISRDKQFQEDRDPASLPRGEVTISGLLREPWKKNWFTPKNKPQEGKFFFPDVHQMAAVVGSEPVWIEETMAPSLLDSYDREAKGRPIGRPAEVNLRNNHAQYIFTWYVQWPIIVHLVTHKS